MRPLAVSPLPAEAEAAALAERLEAHAAQLMALARRVREAIRDCSAEAANEPIAPLPERLGEGPAGQAWRDARAAAAQRSLREKLRPERVLADRVGRVMECAGPEHRARMCLLDAVQDHRQGDDPQDTLDAFGDEHPEWRGAVTVERFLGATAVSTRGPGAPRRGQGGPEQRKWVRFATLCRAIGAPVSWETLMRAWRNWRRAGRKRPSLRELGRERYGAAADDSWPAPSR